MYNTPTPCDPGWLCLFTVGRRSSWAIHSESSNPKAAELEVPGLPLSLPYLTDEVADLIRVCRAGAILGGWQRGRHHVIPQEDFWAGVQAPVQLAEVIVLLR